MPAEQTMFPPINLDSMADLFYQEGLIEAPQLLSITKTQDLVTKRNKLKRSVSSSSDESCLSDEVREVLRFLDSEGESCTEESYDDGEARDFEAFCPMCPEPISKTIWESRHGQRLVTFFNSLSLLINAGKYDEFTEMSDDFHSQIKMGYDTPELRDMKFVMTYLSASLNLMRNKLNESRSNIENGLKIAASTSNPAWSTAAIFSSKCWQHFAEESTDDLRNSLDDAASIIEQNPQGCLGLASAWIYIDKARFLLSSLSTCSTRVMLKHRSDAINCLYKAIDHFRAETSADGPYGVGVASVLLARTLLFCGDRLQTLSFQPPRSDIEAARNLLLMVEDSEHEIEPSLKLQIVVAMCDYHIRFHQLQRAFQFAQDGRDLATSMNIPHHVTSCDIRLTYLRKQLSHTNAIHFDEMNYVTRGRVDSEGEHKPYQLTLKDQKAIKYKHKTWKEYSQTETGPSKFKEYTRARNEVTKIIRRAKRDMESNICSKVETNAKLFWK
ncbi:hypothetical protein CAPTEDRAFT_196212 [Capitella teleta]|uniref:Uncharacterized protein n=1 Tax=Capitella teleta TaxID=283909 RepID=R7U0V7_CAPTE|nr:hypothetical protein CAPTEDRAFT_196212 [Capitella teleta]|eukprot:ELT99517.1 hypothetical protein CAPTEDRAFT_196212 [Capitella teleta]